MAITVADLIVNGALDSVLEEVPVNPLCPPDSTAVESCGNIDICTGGQFSAVINVEAEPPNGDMCQAEGEYTFTFPVPPTPPPTSPPPTALPVTSPPPTPPGSPPPTPPGSPPPCTIELSTECTIKGGENDGQACDALAPPVTICLQRPYAATMLFNGGGCEQSDNTQNLKFTCEDFEGGPSTSEPAYIIVTDIKGLGITYFEGPVEVGELFDLNDNEELFEPDMFISIFTPDQSTLLQKVQFHTSCSRNLELLNRFGASQLVEFINEKQGVVSSFSTVSFAIEVALPITATSTESIELTSMTVMASFTETTDLTNQVAGTVIGPDSPSVVVSFEGTINAAEPMTYTIAYNVEGERVSDGALCTGMDMDSFEVGPDPNAPVPTDGGISPPSTSEGGGTAPTPAVVPAPTPAVASPSPSPGPGPTSSLGPTTIVPAETELPAPAPVVLPAPTPAVSPAPSSVSKSKGKGSPSGSGVGTPTGPTSKGTSKGSTSGTTSKGSTSGSATGSTSKGSTSGSTADSPTGSTSKTSNRR